MNQLTKVNQDRRGQIEAFRDRKIAQHRAAVVPKLDDYPLPKLERRIATALAAKWGRGPIEPHFELIERARYGGDVALKLPQLLRDGGPKEFIQSHLPWIVEVLSGPEFADAIERVDAKGMYINLTVSNRWLLNGAQAAADLGARFGSNDSMATRTFVVDYSAPNVGKVLHAGHIRSTIVGQVLSNLYEANGALVYGINHINDFGGFGFALEGYRRFAERFPSTLSENGKLVEIYRIRRALERIVEIRKSLDDISEDERELVSRYFPEVMDSEELTRQFRTYTAASDARFSELEAGAKQEIELWQQMVAWSLADFDRFYDALNIHFDLVIGESFYFEAGDAVIDQCLATGKAIVYTKELADQDIKHLDESLSAGEITSIDHDNLARRITKDIGAFVVPLDRGERLVVRRTDGRSIYATRDMGAIKLRSEIFHPTDMIYVVGQEQRVHFDRVFRAAYEIGLASPEDVRLQHVYFGYYVDAMTGKKLSSRETVANVTHMLTESESYFRSRLSDRVDQTENDLDQAARELAVGSLVFNDFKQDIKGAVEIDTTDINATIMGFEKSGGAYVVYAACRARSILRRLGRKPTPADQIKEFELDDQEVDLLLKIQQIPQKVDAAARHANPSILVRHLLDVATIYNSYYTRAPVIVDGVANPARILITQAVQQSLTSGLALCHVRCPEAI
ncbi:MAG TPA: arginine--tRNA ligase [Candidatus Baltobacteraceae bacterium]|jgi:arginyl-tRNA synthetase|nr:arginine--tRNA ligase [Candidatus Baltobacteraceae bacterium]